MTRSTRSSAARALAAPKIWIPPLALLAVVVFVMTLVYLGSVVDPVGHLHGLRVGIVNQDRGARVGSATVNLGETVAAGLERSPAVTSRLALGRGDLATVQHRMSLGKDYAAVVIPPGFTAALLAIGGRATPGDERPSRATIELLTNPRLGNIGVSLARGVLQPALAGASAEIGQRLRTGIRGPRSEAVDVLLSDPVAVAEVAYRPLPRHTALGLSAFYIALLTTFCGFLGGTLVHVAIDSVLGYAATEIGPHWRLRQPVSISRWHTLLAKSAVLVPLTVILTGLMLLAASVLGMDMPHFWELWLLTWFAATAIGLGTLVLFAALGTAGQLVALLVFIYLALASSGGTVPLPALSGIFRFFAEFEPLRQILAGTRSILYFDASGAAGLTRAFIATAIGLGFWATLGAAITKWYDRKGLDRLTPELVEYVDEAVRGYRPAG